MKRHSVFNGFFRLYATVWVISVLVAIGLGCSRHGEEKGANKRAMPVTVADAVKKTVPVQLSAVGVVEAYKTVSVKAQVGGELVKVHFEEGQLVKAGEPLFTIDPRPFEAQLRHARANLAKDTALLDKARKLLARNSSVVDKGYVSKEQFDQSAADVSALEATVKADEAACEDAELQLKYCFISSPINACAGEVKVHMGNLVKASDNDNPLVTLKQISPIYVGFHIPEKDLFTVKEHMASKKLKAEVSFPGQNNIASRGELSFLDNTVNPSTGTILLKATFPNKDRALWPGQFVNVLLTLTSQPDAVVVPSQAVQTGQDGKYVFVVKADLTVDYRPVVEERAVGNETVIRQGIQPGEQVVTDGQLRLFPGATVKIIKSLNGKAVQTQS
ncbi:Efflux transporter, RND family, MFP subunit [uncultured Desulfobacterium sp.]|uniref:Efflux transporter, RND family, MFP subunit n=1 Tax=uncultured Desulfobacterium sp. TaxID=201089 RepID=A0A445MRS7_9BACT|nr:Efflux transporter, RND family, MFP subunit [uncultured Desulfobacterium sp.]